MEIMILATLLILIGFVLVLVRQSIVLTKMLNLMDEELIEQGIKLIEIDNTLSLVYCELPDKDS